MVQINSSLRAALLGACAIGLAAAGDAQAQRAAPQAIPSRAGALHNEAARYILARLPGEKGDKRAAVVKLMHDWCDEFHRWRKCKDPLPPWERLGNAQALIAASGGKEYQARLGRVVRALETASTQAEASRAIQLAGSKLDAVDAKDRLNLVSALAVADASIILWASTDPSGGGAGSARGIKINWPRVRVIARADLLGCLGGLAGGVEGCVIVGAVSSVLTGIGNGP